MTGSSLGNGDELPFSWAYLGMCVFVGFLSAASLPLGSVLGLQWQPNSLVTGVMEAFGGGALLAALSVTMVAPISLGAADHSLPADERQTYRVQLAVLVLSAMLGGTCFILLDQLITRKGGELRKWYGQARYYGVQRGTKATVEAKKFRTLQSSSLFGVLSAPRQLELVRMLKPLVFHENDVLYCKGECSDRLMFIRKGTVELQNEPGQPFWIAGAGDVLGSTGILTNGPQPQTAIAVSDVEVNGRTQGGSTPCMTSGFIIDVVAVSAELMWCEGADAAVSKCVVETLGVAWRGVLKSYFPGINTGGY